MPATYEIDEAREIVFSRATGQVTEAELFAHQDALRSDPRFRPHFRQLYDCSEATEAEVSAEVMRRLAKETPFAPVARRALVSPHSMGYGLMRMFQVLADPHLHNIQVFREMEEARLWLGLDA